MIIFSSYVCNISSATVYFMAIYSFYLLLLFSFFFERHSSSMRLISVWLLPLLEKITEEICLYCESESFVCISNFKLFYEYNNGGSNLELFWTYLYYYDVIQNNVYIYGPYYLRYMVHITRDIRSRLLDNISVCFS